MMFRIMEGPRDHLANLDGPVIHCYNVRSIRPFEMLEDEPRVW